MGNSPGGQMKDRNSFGVYPRNLKSGRTIYYYWAYNDRGRRLYRSTGEDTYEKAVRHCRNLLKQGKLATDIDYQFLQYTQDFFMHDRCPYVKSRLLRGKSYTKGWAQAQRNLLLSRIIPEFGDFDIREIFEKRIEAWLLRIKQEGVGNKTLNHLITVLRIIFGYAFKSRDIDDNPMTNISLFSIKTREKGILSREEIYRLFSGDTGTIWGTTMHLALNLTAITTGMRLGELLALKYEMVQPNFITVAYSWSETDELKCPKNGKIRKIPISESLYRLLHSLNHDRQASDFIFSHGKKPISHKTVYKQFYKALYKIGISKELRKEKNISFHSYRHLFNSLLLESGIAPETIRLLTGHSAGMTARYSHIQLTNIKFCPVIDFYKPQSLFQEPIQVLA